MFFRRKTCKSISDFRRKQAEQKKAEEKAAEEAAHRAAMEREGVKQNKARRTHAPHAPHAHAPQPVAEDVFTNWRSSLARIWVAMQMLIRAQKKFDQLDADGSGYLSGAELMQVVNWVRAEC